ncbi:MAG TPA: hypothetical protein VME45_16720 [Stellaceae bacterium]|nr:hypothetical protein [Stellaceae bacterium]
MNSDGVITVRVDRRAVRDAVIDLRRETILALATARTILDRIDEARRDPAPERQP